jgi:hypothetical protein
MSKEQQGASRPCTPFRQFWLQPFIALGATAAMAQDRLEIVATTGMIADAVRGKWAATSCRYPHSWVRAWTRMPIARPAAISSRPPADLVLWHGLYLEAQMEDFLLELGRTRPVVAVADGLPRNLLISHDDYEDRFDPHVWMNPNLWSRVVLEIRDALTDVHPDGAEVFRANAPTPTSMSSPRWRSTRSKCWARSPPKAGSCCRRMTPSTISGRPTGSK